MFGMKKYDANMVNRTISMAWPAILESFFVAFAGLVDSKMVGWGLVGIWLGIFADQFSRFIFGATRFRAGRWTQIKM